jgi:hypothetical protein
MSSFDKSQTRKRRKTKATARKITMMAKTTRTTTAIRSEHGKTTVTFSEVVDKLQQHYGSPAPPPPSTDPLELIIWENIAYLASDKRRAEAFATLKQTIGTRPEQILAAQHSALAAIGKAGILPDISAEKLLTIAKIAFEEFDGELRAALKKPLSQAKKALKRISRSIATFQFTTLSSASFARKCSMS